MERGGRRFVYPPIHTFIDEYGDTVYRVELSDSTVDIIVDCPGNPLSPEEALEMVHEMLRDGIDDGRYPITDFYPPDAQVQNMQLPYAAVQEQEEEAYSRDCSGRIPASGDAIEGLLETSVKEGECSVCLLDFETSSKLRVMPCSHYFHEQCIFTWLRLNHVCPLCRFPLPTEKEQ